MEQSNTRQREYYPGRYWCPHCEESVAQRTYNEHFRLYYNSDQQSWAKKPRIEVDIQITENVAADIEDLSDIEVKLNYNYCVLVLYFCHVTAYIVY